MANEELHDLYCLPNIIWVFKPRIKVWGMWHSSGRVEGHTWIWLGKLEGEMQLG